MMGDFFPVVVIFPGDEVTVYINASTDGVNDIVAIPLPGVAITSVGTKGIPIGTIEFDVCKLVDDPDKFEAITVNVYDIPFVSPVINRGLDDDVAVIPPGIDVAVYTVV